MVESIEMSAAYQFFYRVFHFYRRRDRQVGRTARLSFAVSPHVRDLATIEINLDDGLSFNGDALGTSHGDEPHR